MVKIVIILLIACLIVVLLAKCVRPLSYGTLVKETQLIGEEIPKTVYMTTQDKNAIPKHVIRNWEEFLQGYSLQIFDDQECREFLQTYFQPRVLATFNRLKGAHRADLFRYCLLYVRGGVYMDIKTKLIKPLGDLNFMFNPKTVTTSLSIMPKTIYQGIISTPPGNTLFLDAVDRIVRTPAFFTKIQYHIFTGQFYDILSKESSSKQLQPGTNQLEDGTALVLFSEHCTTQCSTPDRYGRCCSLMYNGEPVFDVRWSDYPWKDLK
jgi:hypothetical protein